MWSAFAAVAGEAVAEGVAAGAAGLLVVVAAAVGVVTVFLAASVLPFAVVVDAPVGTAGFSVEVAEVAAVGAAVEAAGAVVFGATAVVVAGVAFVVLEELAAESFASGAAIAAGAKPIIAQIEMGNTNFITSSKESTCTI